MLGEGVVVLIILLACSIAPETAATMYRYLWQVVFAVIRLYKHEVEVRPPLHCGRMNVNPPVYYIVQK